MTSQWSAQEPTRSRLLKDTQFLSMVQMNKQKSVFNCMRAHGRSPRKMQPEVAARCLWLIPHLKVEGERDGGFSWGRQLTGRGAGTSRVNSAVLLSR